MHQSLLALGQLHKAKWLVVGAVLHEQHDDSVVIGDHGVIMYK